MSNYPNLEPEEIDLSDLFARLWAHKVMIALFTFLSVVLAVYYLATVDKKFTAQAVFQIQPATDNKSFNLPSELGALASLAGLTGGLQSASSTEILIERATRREFIIQVKEKSSLNLDPYFNPKKTSPLWTAALEKFIGEQKTKEENEAVSDTNIIRNYNKNVKFDMSEGGSILISVTHLDPRKAAQYANDFMEELRLLVKKESAVSQQKRLNYLSETLADALQEMENAQVNLKNYALQNSAMAQENFISDSLKLDEIRMEKRKVADIADLLSIIESLLKSGNLDTNSYETLRSSHPLVDDIEFRRILGMSETISAWVWPEIETIEAVSTTLRDRIKRLDVEIKNIEENAKIYATSAEDLAKYTRDARIAEATYTVLIEQVKAQTLAAGFQPETFKVFEYATPPLEPSSPKNILVLLSGTILGILIGGILALINARNRDVYYTRSALISDANANLILKSKSLKRLSRKSIYEVISLISRRNIIGPNEGALKLANKKIIYVLNSGDQPSSSNTAKLLAAQSAQSGRDVLLCDTTGQLNKEIKGKSIPDSPDTPIVKVDENISIMEEVDGTSFLTSNQFGPKIKDLTKRFDQIFLCTSNRNAHLGLMALSEFVPGIVVISSLRKTKKLDIKNIKTIQPIDLLFYD